jgi:dihydroxyacid dehydratase/phosphogluconate dehydratase
MVLLSGMLHRSFDGGGIALVKNGDTITIDAVKRLILKFLTKFASRKANGYNPNQKLKKIIIKISGQFQVHQLDV